MATADEEFLAKLNAAFVIEAAEHAQALAAGLLELENGAAGTRQREIIEEIFREAHSLKGAARSVNRADIEAVCQAMETVFSSWKKEQTPRRRGVFDALGRAVDFLERAAPPADAAQMQRDAAALVQDIRAVDAAASDARSTAARADNPADAPRPPAAEARRAFSEALPGAETVRIRTAKLDSLLLQAEEMLAAKGVAAQRAGEMREIKRIIEEWQREWRRVGREIRGAPAGTGHAAPSRLMDFLEWNHSCVRSLDQKLSVLAKAVEADGRSLGGMVDDLLADAKQLVLMPFATLLDSFARQVRDLAREQGKEVEILTSGREVEIDKRILEGMKDPLTHLVRNAVDHGIETPPERAAKNKPARARLTLAVSQVDAGSVEILVRDDGAGIDASRVREAAARAGALGAETAGQREDAVSMIFLSGVSTSPSVTNISGRGLGMAIVREKTEKLGGRISVETTPGEGTAFRITLPVAMATFRGLRVAASGREFILPVANLERVVRLPREEIRSVENRAAISWNGCLIALARLDDVLEIPRRAVAGESPCVQAVILGAGEKCMAFAVDDDVLDEQEILVKPLSRPLLRVRNIAAATVLASGKTLLILNVPDLLQSAGKLAGASEPFHRLEPAAPARAARAQAILVADDSVTSRMLLKNILESAGYRVRTAIDGMEALATLREQPFDLVVSDVEMPRMDGFELCAKIRADQRLAALPIVLVTSMESREHRERGVGAGADAYIVKSSFDQSDLLETVRRMI